MPNHCFNEISIDGRPEDVRALDARITAAGGFSFATFVPVPDHVCVDGTGSNLIGRDPAGAWALVPWTEQPDGTRAPDPTDLTHVGHRSFHTHQGALVLDEEMRERGLVDWYAWRLAHWGTKWDAYNVDGHGSVDDGILCFEFDSAWRPPVPVVLAMQAQHPNLAIHLHATEPNMRFQVTVTEEGAVFEEPYELEHEVDRDDDPLDDGSAPPVAVAP